MLEVKSSNKGMLIPRTSSSSRISIANPAKGLVLYDTTTSSFWFHNGSAWKEISTGSNGWNLTGNAGTSASTNFVGTTDLVPLRLRVNNKWAGELNAATGNSFIGPGAGEANTTGVSNTAFGLSALAKNTGANNNVAVGDSSRYSQTGAGTNVAVGTHVLFANTSGNANTGMGPFALFSNTTGGFNTGIGVNALNHNITGDENTGIGSRALQFNESDFNTAAGASALRFNTTGTVNTAIGYAALYSNIAGTGNTAVGRQALYSNNSSSNTAVGASALSSETNGFGNVAVGYFALGYLVSGENNIAIGDNSGTAYSTPTLNNTISIGNNFNANDASNQAFIGNTSMTWIGGQVGWFHYSDARIKTGVQEGVKGLDFILKLRPVTYHKNLRKMLEITGNKDSKDFPGKYDIEKIQFSGFLAQEVEKAAKETGYDFNGVHTPNNPHDLYSLSYAEFTVPLEKAVQEQQTIIKAQQEEIDLLKKRLDKLEQQ
jgi:hypothetical protein